MSTTVKTVIECPHCKNQLQLDSRLTFASGPRSSEPASGSDDLGALLGQIMDDGLTGQVAEFVTQTRERYEKYGSRTRMSEKQLAWLKRIADGETGQDEWS